MKKELTWQKQLTEIMESFADMYFGKNVEWELKDVRRFISKLEKLGACDVKILDDDSIDFELPAPVDCHDIFLFIMTSTPRPSYVKHKKSKYNSRLMLEWRY